MTPHVRLMVGWSDGGAANMDFLKFNFRMTPRVRLLVGPSRRAKVKVTKVLPV